MNEEKSLLGTLLTWVVGAILIVIALKVAFIVLGVTMALAGIALRLLPLLLVGGVIWLAVRWIQGGRCRSDAL
ncbi:MAG: hypothetical protein M3483_01040 [Gemmatimonadota bacterium]|nr:hypothetical protein [Gemmatimonadota bacterium]